MVLGSVVNKKLFFLLTQASSTEQSKCRMYAKQFQIFLDKYSPLVQHIIWFKHDSDDIIRTKPIPVEIAVGLNRFFLQRANIGWILEVSQKRLSLGNWLTKTMHFVWDIDVEKLPHFKIWSRFWKGSMKLVRPNDHILKR